MPNVNELDDSYLNLVTEAQEALHAGKGDREELIERFESLADAAEKTDTKLGRHLAVLARDDAASLARGGLEDRSDEDLERLLDEGRG